MKKVLVIDDDLDILEAIRFILDSGGYASKLITKGEKTYEMVRDFKPDLIILDVLLSGNDGRLICQNLKADKSTKKIPIIMISAHPTAKKSVKECGADSFLPKPFTVDELLIEVERFIGQSR
jgi:DNA-binding response OmpR family regulator